jgi:hypothetical protein
MKSTFSVKNWENFQHYKDRNPPWIKLHNHLLDDYDFECLPDATKCHLLCIWMLASRTNNEMIFDNSWVKRKIGANSNVDLDLLVRVGFIEVQGVEHDASKALVLEEERRGETEKRRVDISTLQQVESLPAVCSFPLNDNTFFYLHQEQFSKWVNLYLAVDVESELRKMIGWLDANPSKRKTRKGFMRFANGWLSKQQDKGGSKASGKVDILIASSESNWHEEDLGL